MTVPEALSPLHTVTGTMLRGRKETARKSHFFYWSPIFSHFELARGPIFLGSSKITYLQVQDIHLYSFGY